jgi:hypothetical protein
MEAARVTPTSLTATLFPSLSVDISFNDDVIVILLLCGSFKLKRRISKSGGKDLLSAHAPLHQWKTAWEISIQKRVKASSSKFAMC